MSGFLAVRSFDEPVPPDVVEAILTNAEHRGAARVFAEDGIALAAFDGRRGPGLAVAEDLVVAMDLRLDQREQLDALLGAEPETDAERFLLAWRRWGADALRHLLGDFAGAVWDRRRKTLTVVRDPMAGRPALLARARGRVLAASSVRMLLEDPAVDRTPDEHFIAMYLAKGPLFHTATGYGSIARLIPGQRAAATDRGWQTSTWFRWRPRRVRERNDQAYAERFRELFFDAVRCRIDGASRVGVSLSGGLDSTSVALAARAVRPDLDLRAFAIPFDRPPGDERALQLATAERAGARLRWVPLEGTDPFWRGARDALETFGAPPVPPNRFHVDAIADAAAEEGVEVTLDGIDGDSVVGGNFFYLSDLAITLRWRRYLTEMQALRAVQGYGRRFMLRELTVWPLLPATARVAIRRAQGRAHAPWFMDEGFARAHTIERVLEMEPWRPARAFRSDSRLAISPMIAPLVLESMDEQWSRRGIEVAHPFMDRRLVEFCLGLPREQKTRLGYTKVILRNAMRGLLPAEVAERADKANLSEAFLAGLRTSGREELREGLTLAMSNPVPWLKDGAAEQLLARSARDADIFDGYRVAFLSRWIDWLAASSSRATAAP